MRKLITLTFITLFSSATIASSNTIFSCITTDGKALNVKSSNDNYIFTYDKISFKNSIKSVIANELSEVAGGSGFTTFNLAFKYNGYDYSVGYIEPRGNSKELIEPGASIQKNGEFIDVMPCNPRKKIQVNFDKKLMRKTGFAS